MSYLYDGLSFKVLAEGRDASGLDATGRWHGRSGRQFKPTSEYLRTGRRLVTRTDVTTEGHSLLEPWLGGYQSKKSYLQDEQGSVIGELDKRGRLTARYRYDAFGALTEGRFDGINRLGYNGKRVDGYSGRYDYGYRDYDPLTMRWTTVDPVKDGVNWYSYVRNDPVNLIDPLGLFTLQLGVSAAGGTGAGGTTGTGGAIAWDKSNPFRLEFSTYNIEGIGSHFGGNVSTNLDVSFSSNNSVEDLSGPAVSSGASGGLPTGPAWFGGAIEQTESMTGAEPVSTVSLAAGAGTPYEGHIYYTETQVNNVIVIDLNNIKDSIMDTANDFVNSVKDLIIPNETTINECTY